MVRHKSRCDAEDYLPCSCGLKPEPTGPSVWEVCACNHAKESHTLDGVCLQSEVGWGVCTCMKFEPVINVPKLSVADDYCPGHCGACDEKHRRIEEAVAKQTEGLVAQLRDSHRVLRERIGILEADILLRRQDIATLELTNRNLSRKIAYEIARSKNGS